MDRHVIWDMGGTLVDTYPQLDAALAEVVTRHGKQVTTPEVAALTRVSTHHAITTLADRFGISEAEFEAANAELKEHWRTHPAPAMPGAHALMADIAARGGLNLVATHRDRRSAESLLESLGLAVDDLVCPEDGLARKPDPAMLLELLGRHHLDPATVLAVGDRPIDVEAAHRAGIAAALLRGDQSEQAEPGKPSGPADADADADADAEHVIATLDDLRPVLGLPA